MFGNLKKAIRNPYAFSVISKFFGVFVGFIFTVFQSRYLGATIKGQVATVNSIVSITSIVFGFGIFHAYPYFKRTTRIDIMPIFMKISLLILVAYGAVSTAAIALMHLPPLYIAVLILTPLLTYDAIVSYITLIEVPNKKSATDMAVVFMELVILIVLWLTAPPSFAIGVFVITIKDVVKAMLFTFWWRKRIFIPSESIVKWIPTLVRFGFFPMLSLLMTTLNYRVDVLMLNGRVPDAAIGVYSVGVLLAERIWMVPDAMRGVLVSNITKGKDAGEAAYVIRLCNTACLFIVLGIIILGRPFINIVFGDEYRGAYTVTLILLMGVFSMSYYRLIASYNIAMGQQRISFILLSIGVAANVIANLALIPAMGIYGAGIASVISYALCSILFIVYFCWTTKISFSNMILLKGTDFEKLRNKLRRR